MPSVHIYWVKEQIARMLEGLSQYQQCHLRKWLWWSNSLSLSSLLPPSLTLSSSWDSWKQCGMFKVFPSVHSLLFPPLGYHQKHSFSLEIHFKKAYEPLEYFRGKRNFERKSWVFGCVIQQHFSNSSGEAWSKFRFANLFPLAWRITCW